MLYQFIKKTYCFGLLHFSSSFYAESMLIYVLYIQIAQPHVVIKYVQLNPANNGNPPITEDILWSLEMFVFNFYIGNNRNPSITDENGWSLEIR